MSVAVLNADMTGRVALITGAASGLGAEDARTLAAAGAKVVLTDLADEAGEKLAAEIGGKFLHQDVRDEARWGEVVAETLAAFGRLDVLVNNAGLVRFDTIDTLSYADWKLQTEIMLDGTFLGCRAALPHMSREGTGSIINMSSVAAVKGISTIPAYCAAKAGVVALTRSIAIHCREQANRIRCNAILPGAIVTPMTAQALAQLPGESAGLEQVQAHGMGQPADIANMVLYLASDLGRHLTGSAITIDNGETIA